MDTRLYETILNDGLNLSSPSAALSEQLSDGLGSTESLLSSLSNTPVDPTVVNNAATELQSASSTLVSAMSHINKMAGDSPRLIGLAESVNRIDAAVNQLPSSCFNSTALFGSVNGDADDCMNKIGVTASSINQCIAQYQAGEKTQEQLESCLSAQSTDLKKHVDCVEKTIQREIALLKELKAKLNARAMAQLIWGQWDSPCVKDTLKTVLPSSIQQILP